MRNILIIALFSLAVVQIFADDKLECYQCEPVTQECTVEKANVVPCGTYSTSKCSKQVKKGSSDASKAIRKCVVPDKNGQVLCPDNYDCTNCNSDQCNSGTNMKVTWFSLAAVFFTALYI
ncbi:uncharacterized protein LOC662275 [Tribolium castaneum]|uniref:Protein sleepless n=1 Tax=Tribolium castaneum TaxID=7070 RepID=D6WXR2_TRICA|nr:PREDICTED: uncharacterized protein LOC662275 [Tribolium castaneum]EFA08893.1 hypothetical protein TcasGA2_TC006594 [Tribolium castaneum]|eukprot:XP_976418.1 PREDICTED: uncharacterized protein LOC662275 [Tribolium castaneum]